MERPAPDDDTSCKFYAIALYDYTPLESDQLALVAGNLLAVVNDDSAESTGWLGALNLDTGAAGWVSDPYVHRLDSELEADEYVQSRSASPVVDGNPVDTLASLTARLAAASLSLPPDDNEPSTTHGIVPTLDVETSSITSIDPDRRSIASVGGASLASMATYGSTYPSSNFGVNSVPNVSSDHVAGLGPVDMFLRQRLLPDFQTDSGSNSGSGSSGSTIKSSRPSASLRTVSSVGAFSFANSAYSLDMTGSGTSSFIGSGSDSLFPHSQRITHETPSPSSSRFMTSTTTTTHRPAQSFNPHQALSSPPSTSTAPFLYQSRAFPPDSSYSGSMNGSSLLGQTSMTSNTGGSIHPSQSLAIPSGGRIPARERPGIIIPSSSSSSSRQAVLRGDNGLSPGTGTGSGSLHAPSVNVPSAASPTQSISMASDSSGRSSSKGSISHTTNTTGLTTPSSLHSNQHSLAHATSVSTLSGLSHLSRTSRTSAAEKRLGTDELLMFDNPLREDAVDPASWYLGPSFHPGDLRFNGEGNVEAGTLGALVEWMTAPRARVTPNDVEFRKVFLSTYRTFTDAATLCKLLIGRYEMVEPSELNSDQFEDWKMNKLRPVQLQVLTVFKSWAQDYHLVDSEPAVLPRIREFLDYIKSPEKHEQMAKAVLQLLDSSEPESEKLPSSPQSPTSAVSTGSLSSRRSHRSKAAPFRRKTSRVDALKFSASDIANQLFLMEWAAYSKISAYELICLAKDGGSSGSGSSSSSSSLTSDVRNISKYSVLNRKVGKAAKYIILTTDPATRRRDFLLHLITVAERCKAMHNYATFHFLLVGIMTPCIEKLSFTWQHVNKPRLDELRSLTRSVDGYAAYKNAFNSVGSASCIPVIGIYMPALKKIHDKRPDEIQVEPGEPVLINFGKRREWAKVTAEALRFQARVPPPDLCVENPEIMAWIEEQLEAAYEKPESWFLEKAADVQKREADHTDIRKGLEAAGF